MNNKKQTAMMELLSIIDGVLEYSHNPLLQQISDAGNKLLEKERKQLIIAHAGGAPIEDGVFIALDKAIDYYEKTYGGKND